MILHGYEFISVINLYNIGHSDLGESLPVVVPCKCVDFTDKGTIVGLCHIFNVDHCSIHVNVLPKYSM